MSKISRYITKTTLLFVLIVSIVLIGIYVIFSFVGESSDIGQGGYNVFAALEYVLLSIPNNLSFLLPAAALIGTLLGLGQLASHSELIAIRASGGSIVKIAFAVGVAASVIVLISFILSAFLGPMSASRAMVSQISAKDGRAFLLTPQSTWLKDGDNFIYIGASSSAQSLTQVKKYNFQSGQLTQIMSAKQANFGKGQWQLRAVKKTHISTQGVSTSYFKTMIWPDLVSPSLLKVVSSRVQNLDIIKLYEYIQYRSNNHLSTGKYELRFWQIIFQPISVLVLMLMAVPFAFGPLRSSTVGVRLVFGIVLGFAFFVFNRFFGPFSLVLGVRPVLGALIPSVFCFVTMCVALWRMN